MSEEKLDKLLESVYNMVPIVKDSSDSIKRIEEKLLQIQLGDARQDERILEHAKDLDALGNKLRGHANDHWKFVGIMGGVIGILASIVKAMGHGNK